MTTLCSLGTRMTACISGNANALINNQLIVTCMIVFRKAVNDGGSWRGGVVQNVQTLNAGKGYLCHVLKAQPSIQKEMLIRLHRK